MTIRSAMTGHDGNDADPKVAIGFKYSQSKKSRNPVGGGVCQSLSSENHDAAVAYGFSHSNSNTSLQTKPSEECGMTIRSAPTGEGAAIIDDNLSRMRYIVRRLTPTEAERLMGLPDGYTIPRGLQITDDLVAEFQRIFDTFGLIMAEYERRDPPKPKTANQVRKWLETIANPATCPDSPRYKACGNGWATNQPRWILTRLLAKEGMSW